MEGSIRSSRLLLLSLFFLLAPGLTGCALFQSQQSGQQGPQDQVPTAQREGKAMGGQGYVRPEPWRTPRSHLPNRLELDDDDIRLPDAVLNGRGGVRALVFPIKFGQDDPQWTDTLIAKHIIGTPNIGTPQGVRGAAGRLSYASDHLFQLDATVFPYLVDASLGVDAVQDQVVSRDYVRHVVRAWAQRTNLAPFDNDGPDGVPSSSDDDGVLDMVILVAETEDSQRIRSFRVPGTVPAGVNGDKQLRIGTAHLVSLKEEHAQDPEKADDLRTTELVMGAMGLTEEEMFFPASFERPISTLARIRLGWSFAHWASQSARYSLPDQHTLVVPIVDVSQNRGMWLVERDGRVMYLSRLARRADGHFDVVRTERMWIGDPDTVIPLTSTEGTDGPRMRIRWPESDAPPTISTALSANVAQQGLRGLPTVRLDER